MINASASFECTLFYLSLKLKKNSYNEIYNPEKNKHLLKNKKLDFYQWKFSAILSV